ncbi:MAG: hypothetical protein AAGI01_15865, partial [Myxococcota bacterium]
MTDKPEVLYSPMTGQAYFAGTPEYEAGFGPMGEELMPHPPEGYPEVTPHEPAPNDTAQELAQPTQPDPFEDEFAALEDQYGDQVGEDETLESAGIDEAQYGIDPVDAPVPFDPVDAPVPFD